MIKIKSEKEIKDELHSNQKMINIYSIAYKNGDIPIETWRTRRIDLLVTISVLKWVLGENEK